MASHPIFDDDMQAIVDSFVVETREIFEALDNDLVELERRPDDQPLVDRIFRAVHTVKGTAGFLSLEQLSVLAHHFEDVLNRLRRQELDFDPAMMDVLLDAFDHMRLLLQQVIDQDLRQLDLEALNSDLSAIAEGTFEGRTSGDDAQAPPAASAAPAEASAEEAVAEEPEEAEAAAKPAAGTPIESHPIFEDGMREIVDSFVVEAREIFEALDNDLVELERRPDDQPLVDRIFRAVHTVKGTAGFLSLEQLSVLAHHFEDVLNRLRRQELDFDPAMMDVLLDAFDHMRLLLQQVIDQDLRQLDLEALNSDLSAIAEGTFEGRTSAPAEATPEAPAAEAAPAAARQPKEADDAAKAQPESVRRATRVAASETIRVEVERLDHLMDLVGELVLGRNRLVQLVEEGSQARTAEALTRDMAEMSSQVDFITTELQAAVMHTRMVQIGRVFNKFPRVVRDLAREFKKEINLEIEGEETELDKSLVEEIADPLVHLIRNAADHGVEQPDVREANGKSRQGTVRLTASHEGNNIVIVIEDDGKGIDPDVIRAKGVEKGLISSKEASEMTDGDVLQLIFRAGFSTAQQISQVSGRGVGMDVVKTNLTRLNGSIDIQSTPGEGTRFVMKLPLTLAIIQSLLVKVGDETFAIPLHAVTEVLALEDAEVSTMHGREVMRHRDRVLPLMRVGETLSTRGYRGRDRQAYAVIVALGHRQIGLVVDDLISQKEIVIKPLGNFLKKVPAVAGSTILGDGRVIMILDIAELIRIQQETVRKAA